MISWDVQEPETIAKRQGLGPAMMELCNPNAVDAISQTKFIQC